MSRGPGPVHHDIGFSGPARPDQSVFPSFRQAQNSEAHETRALYGPASQARGPTRGVDGAGHWPVHVLPRVKRCTHKRSRVLFSFILCFPFIFFLDSVSQLFSVHEAHNMPTPHAFSFANDAIQWLPSRVPDHHLSLLLLKYSQPQLMLLPNVLLQHLLSTFHQSEESKDNASEFLVRDFHATAAVLIAGSTATRTKVNSIQRSCLLSRPTSRSLHHQLPLGQTRATTSDASCVAETARSILCTPRTAPRFWSGSLESPNSNSWEPRPNSQQPLLTTDVVRHELPLCCPVLMGFVVNGMRTNASNK